MPAASFSRVKSLVPAASRRTAAKRNEPCVAQISPEPLSAMRSQVHAVESLALDGNFAGRPREARATWTPWPGVPGRAPVSLANSLAAVISAGSADAGWLTKDSDKTEEGGGMGKCP